MKILVEGHKYELVNFENKETTGQTIQFIQKEPIEAGSTQLVTIADGTTNEDLLEVLIDRLTYLNNKFPCKENSCCITHLQEGLMWLEKRTSDRVKRQVEGTNNK